MAKQIMNEKKFLILQVDKQDMDNINSPGICDFCDALINKGKYIAVLNRIFCDKCYDEWTERAVNSPSDRHIEEKNFAIYSMAFTGKNDNLHMGMNG